MTTLDIKLQKDQRYLYILIGLCCALLAAYMYFLSATIMHVVVRKEVSQSMVELNSKVATLESQYIEVQHTISEDIASQRGFIATEDKIFVNRTNGAVVLLYQDL